MVNDIKKKYQEELISERIQIKEDIDLLESKIKEENKFLALLLESNETYFKEFTPRDINAKNTKKAEEIKEYITGLQSQIDLKNQQMKFYDGRLSEINNLLNYPLNSNNIVNNDKINNDFNMDKDYLISALNEIKNIVLLDPQRAQIELEKLISTL